jgi:hypothetical protein
MMRGTIIVEIQTALLRVKSPTGSNIDRSACANDEREGRGHTHEDLEERDSKEESSERDRPRLTAALVRLVEDEEELVLEDEVGRSEVDGSEDQNQRADDGVWETSTCGKSTSDRHATGASEVRRRTEQDDDEDQDRLRVDRSVVEHRRSI